MNKMNIKSLSFAALTAWIAIGQIPAMATELTDLAPMVGTTDPQSGDLGKNNDALAKSIDPAHSACTTKCATLTDPGAVAACQQKCSAEYATMQSCADAANNAVTSLKNVYDIKVKDYQAKVITAKAEINSQANCESNGGKWVGTPVSKKGGGTETQYSCDINQSDLTNKASVAEEACRQDISDVQTWADEKCMKAVQSACSSVSDGTVQSAANMVRSTCRVIAKSAETLNAQKAENSGNLLGWSMFGLQAANMLHSAACTAHWGGYCKDPTSTDTSTTPQDSVTTMQNPNGSSVSFPQGSAGTDSSTSGASIAGTDPAFSGGPSSDTTAANDSSGSSISGVNGGGAASTPAGGASPGATGSTAGTDSSNKGSPLIAMASPSAAGGDGAAGDAAGGGGLLGLKSSSDFGGLDSNSPGGAAGAGDIHGGADGPEGRNLASNGAGGHKAALVDAGASLFDAVSNKMREMKKRGYL